MGGGHSSQQVEKIIFVWRHLMLQTEQNDHFAKTGSGQTKGNNSKKNRFRVNSWVSGGFLPAKVRGTKYEGLACGWDWYGTFSGMCDRWIDETH